MLRESYAEFIIRWHLYRRWRRPRRPSRQAEYDFHRLMRRLPKGGLFVDLGANVGTTTRTALRYGMRVIAFEPDPVARAVLLNSVAGNQNVRVVPKAVGASARTAVFYQRGNAGDLNGTESSSLFGEDAELGNSFEVEVVDLVQFLKGLGEPVAVLKMDIEGAEAECIEALLDAQLHKQIGNVLVETHERFSPELAERIGALRTRIKAEDISNINMDWA